MTAPERPTPEALAFVEDLAKTDAAEWVGGRYKTVALALDRFAAQRAAEAVSEDGPTIAELEASIKPLYLAAKPSREAQAIRSSLSTAFDDPKYRKWMADFIPDYVWDLVDIAAQRGRDSAATPPPGDAGEVRRAAQTVLHRFKSDIEQGYVTRDKRFAVDVLSKALETGDAPSSQENIADHHFDGGSFGGGDQGECAVCGRDAKHHAPQPDEIVTPAGDAGERARPMSKSDEQQLAVIREGVHTMAEPFHLHRYNDWKLLLRLLDEAHAEIAALQSERTAAASQAQAHPDEARAYAYLQHLLSVVAPQCEPLPDLIGLCTQIDSVIVWVKDQATSQARRETLEEAAVRAETTLYGEKFDESDAFGRARLSAASDIRALAARQESAS